jgi:copper(I)-binding protein
MMETPATEACPPSGRTRQRNQQFRLVAALAGLGFALAAAVTHAAKGEDGSISVLHAWARPTPQGAKVGAGYVTIVNSGKEADRLLSASAPFAGQAEIHQTSMVNGVMKMRRVTDGIAIPPGRSLVLEPNSYHLMFTRLSEPLKQGDSVTGTLIFERAGKIAVTFQVLGMGAQGPDAAPHH